MQCTIFLSVLGVELAVKNEGKEKIRTELCVAGFDRSMDVNVGEYIFEH